jgi:D-apionate oxidoisomerase
MAKLLPSKQITRVRFPSPASLKSRPASCRAAFILDVLMKIALLGAGGKIGTRIVNNLLKTDHDARYLEVSEAGIAHLAGKGVTVSSPEAALPDAEVVILAVPDTILGKVSASVVPILSPGTIVLALDPAAPLAGEIAHRDDLVYAVAHPCHPSVFAWEPTEAAFKDFYGGVAASQVAVVALLHGAAENIEAVETVAQTIFAPVSKIHRLTLEQMALLEPGLAETLQQTCLEVIKEGMDEIIARGVPAEAARDFLLGHLRIQTAILFNEVPGRFSDAAYKISAHARPLIFRDDWKQVLTEESVREQVKVITKS